MQRLEPKQRRPPIAASRKPLILYVEDDEDNWDVAAMRLAPHYALVRAATAQEGCALLRERASEIAFVLMDIELRGSDFSGVELKQLWRGELPATRELPAYARDLPTLASPIIFVTAHTAQHEALRMVLADGDRVISKPINFSELMAALSTLA